MTHTLWYTRCPAPTASGIAFQRNMYGELFAGTDYAVRNIKELPKNRWDTHFNHALDGDPLDALAVMKSFLLQRGYVGRDFSVDQWLAPEALAEARAREGLTQPGAG